MRFMNKSKYFMLFSGAIVLVGIIVGLIFGGLNLGIDFTGGSILTVELHEQYDMQVVQDALSANGIDASTTQLVKAGNDDTQAVIRMQEMSETMDDATVREDVIATLQETYPLAEGGEVESVGGVTTGEIIRNAFLAVLIASAFMLIYIWIRFELFSGLAALTALVHDVLIMTAVVSIARVQINSSYIAAVLTIVGYSINDTIVLFDRIRENNKRYSISSKTRAQVADISIKETLSRTINTSVTTLVMILALYIFGVESIKEFALPLIIGLISGTYSSIFIASPVWVRLMHLKHKKDYKKLTEKIAKVK
ncbi:MAG: protein translocase subunit SecF [Clostridia bacterium]|jgi:preprotein translocase subunit SecF|nr:protein translocase subunit SecF [Clostridia bacterium]MBT7123045.1 protein translocase subunit SecF [Clostridia bacterium]